MGKKAALEKFLELKKENSELKRVIKNLQDNNAIWSTEQNRKAEVCRVVAEEYKNELGKVRAELAEALAELDKARAEIDSLEAGTLTSLTSKLILSRQEC